MNNQIYIVPISCKGIVIENGKVWLRKNEREEWEIPGGKEDVGEQPEETVVREIQEELGLEVSINRIVDAHMYYIEKSIDETKGVLVLSYLCDFIKRSGNLELKGESGNAKYQCFSINEVSTLKMPDFYKKVLQKAGEILGKPE